jgi:hypothetical protein
VVDREDDDLPQDFEHFPATIGDLRTIDRGALLTTMENYYSLTHNGSIVQRRKKLFRVYGVGLITQQGMTVQVLNV